MPSVPGPAAPAPARRGGFTRCPKCGHTPLPEDQRLPAACAACGVILAKVARQHADDGGAATSAIRRPTIVYDDEMRDRQVSWSELLFDPPARHDAPTLWIRSALLVAFAVWGVVLAFLDYRTGAFGSSVIHGPLLIFHEAGHFVFKLGGEWLMVLGGTLGQLSCRP